MENSRGAESATLAPPVSLATQIQDERRSSASSLWRMMHFEIAEAEVTRGLSNGLVLPEDDCDDGAKAEIDATFQRKLAAIRRLPKRDRPFARRAAMEERVVALLALRQKRETGRQFKRYLRQLLAPTPRE